MRLLYHMTLPEKCPNTEFFLVCFFLYSDWIKENTDQKKLRIWTLFTQYERKYSAFSAEKNEDFIDKNIIKFLVTNHLDKGVWQGPKHVSVIAEGSAFYAS